MSALGATLRRFGPAALAALGLLTSSAACAKHPSSPAALTLVWQDEFDGPAGQLPDATKWGFDVGTGWGNSQLEYDTARPENVSLDGAGHLAITARREDWLGQSYTSGRITTRGHLEQATGRFEARMRMPTGSGLWPAFWLLGSNIDTAGWPACGEVDIMEYRGQEPSILHGSLHGPGYSGGNAITKSIVVPGAAMDAAYHVYAVDWTSSKITWSVDGKTYLTVSPSGLPGGASWVFNHPFFVILNLAVGGNFVGPPGPGTAFPQQLLVDYVRVYK